MNNHRTRPNAGFAATTTAVGEKRFKAAVTNFEPPAGHIPFGLKQNEGTRFIKYIADNAARFGYTQLIANFPMDMQPIAQPGTMDRAQTAMTTKHLVRNYDRISPEKGRALANTYFGDGTYVSPGGNDQNIIPFENVIGDTYPDTHAEEALRGELTEQGKKAYMQRLQTEYLATHIQKSISEPAKRYLRINEFLFQWKDNITGEVYNDGVTMLLLCLHRVRPDNVIDTHNLVTEAKAMRLKDFGGNLPELTDAMIEKRDRILEIDSEGYPERMFAGDYFRSMGEGAPAPFRKWLDDEHMKWVTGETVFNQFDLQQRSNRVFTNLTATGRWKKEFDPTQQIVALTTEIGALKKQVASGVAAGAATNSQPPPTGKHRGQRDRAAPLLQPWRLEKGDGLPKTDAEGKVWTWCTQPGHKHNGKDTPMYTGHAANDHAGWMIWKESNYKQRREMKRKREDTEGSVDKSVSNSAKQSADSLKTKQLALKSSLKSALYTDAGVSDSQFDDMWDKCNGSGN